MASATAEAAVRTYLVSLRDPDSLIDAERITEIESQLGQEEDPLTRLQLQSDLRKAKSADTDAAEEQFITRAKEWADAHGVSAEAFIAEGVERSVLQRAGLIAGRSRRSSGGGQRRARVNREDVEKAVTGHKKGKTFTIKDVQEESGGSTATVRKVITELIENGTIEEVGPDEQHSGPGRAPTLYKKA